MMTLNMNQYAQRILFAFLLVLAVASSAKAQFPVEGSGQMVGNWAVSNVDGFSIQIQIDDQNQFRMLVNGKSSSGQLKSSGDNVTLNYSDGTQQNFKKRLSNGQLIFESTTGNQRFVMNRVDSERTATATNTGFPGGQGSTEMSTDEIEDVVDDSPNQQIHGKWYAKMEDQQIEVFIKSEFRQDGTYTTSLLMVAGTEKETQKDTGSWSIQNNKLITISDGESQSEVAPIQFSNDNLIVDMTAEFGTKLVMSRSPEKVRTTQFDVQKLIAYAQGQADGGW